MNLVTNLVTKASLSVAHESESALAQSLYGLIAQRGLVGSKRLQALTGKSQATIARALASLGTRVIQLGKARRTLYAVPKSILGFGGEQALVAVDAQGQAFVWGRLCYLEGQRIYVEPATTNKTSASWSITTDNALPWFLEPLRLQGFLGKLRGAAMGFADSNPEHWSLEQVLFAVLAHEHDNPGAFSLGHSNNAADSAQTHAPRALAARGAYYDSLSQDVAKMVSKGSSAGGEQPKFLATVAASNDKLESLIVKFTPPRGTPFGERWHDLLHAEAMALYVLSQHGIAVAQPRIVQTKTRTYLESVRFDRVAVGATTGTARFAKRHVVSLTSVHTEFVGNARQHWPATCATLHAQGRLSKDDLTSVQTIHAFGNLIGNTDMHFGNLSLFVDDLARLDNPTFSLAPVYDMLPMRYRPSEFRDELGYSAFAIPDANFAPHEINVAASRMALAFWQAMSAHAPISEGFRVLAKEMVTRIEGARLTTPTLPTMQR